MPDYPRIPDDGEDSAYYWRKAAREAQCAEDRLTEELHFLRTLRHVPMIRMPAGPSEPTHFSIIADQRAFLVTVTEWMPLTEGRE